MDNDEKMKGELRLNSDSLTETYADSPMAKAIIPIIPLIGPYLNERFSIRANKITQERIESFLNMLYDGIKDLNDQTLKNDWVNSEQFYDILNNAIESSIRDRSLEKTLLNARILVLAIRGEIESPNLAEQLLYALEGLTPMEINALAIIYQAFAETPELPEGKIENELGRARRAEWKKALIEKGHIEDEDIDFVIKRLENTGLVSEITGAYLSYGGGEIKVSKTFQKLMEYLQQNPVD